MRFLVLLLSLALSAGAAAQPSKRDEGKSRQSMSQEDRRQLRDELQRDVYRDRSPRPERPRQMSPEDREKLRRDIQDANRDLRR
jgi:hypothetical protein